jgi:UDPglucose 6-dehydrogenase
VATEWPEFSEVSLAEVKKRLIAPLVFDGRNLLDPATMKEMGFTYHCIGRNQIMHS